MAAKCDRAGRIARRAARVLRWRLRVDHCGFFAINDRLMTGPGLAGEVNTLRATAALLPSARQPRWGSLCDVPNFAQPEV